MVVTNRVHVKESSLKIIFMGAIDPRNFLHEKILYTKISRYTCMVLLYIYIYVDQNHVSHVKTALLEVSEKWKDIGQVLGLGGNLLNLDQMVMEWLNTSKASLLRLVGAIATEHGGQNPSHAERVAKAFDKGKCRAGYLSCICTCMMNVDSTSVNFSLLVALLFRSQNA